VLADDTASSALAFLIESCVTTRAIR